MCRGGGLTCLEESEKKSCHRNKTITVYMLLLPAFTDKMKLKKRSLQNNHNGPADISLIIISKLTLLKPSISF